MVLFSYIKYIFCNHISAFFHPLPCHVPWRKTLFQQVIGVFSPKFKLTYKNLLTSCRLISKNKHRIYINAVFRYILCTCFVEATSFWSMVIIYTWKQKIASKSEYSQKLGNGNTEIPRMLSGSRHLHQVWWSELDSRSHGEKRETTAIGCFLTSINIFPSWFSWWISPTIIDLTSAQVYGAFLFVPFWSIVF